MKKIKIYATFILVAFAMAISSAQSGETKKLIQNKWVADVEAMKPIIITMLGINPQFAGMDEETKASRVAMALQTMSALKIEYKTDGVMNKTDAGGNSIGTWALSADGKELTIKSDGKSENKYTVIEISKTKLHLLSANGKKLFLKAEQ